MSKSRLLFPVLLGCMFGALSLSAQPSSTAPSEARYALQRPFALVVRSQVLTVEGDWKQGPFLRNYGEAHQGSYIIFVQDGWVYQLTAPTLIAEAERLYAPMWDLSSQQIRLGAQQTVLLRRQEELVRKMKNAAISEEQTKIGADEASIGAEQGKIGREQGHIGEQQRITGVAFYQKVQAMIDECGAKQNCQKMTKLN
jgi:hypothetical protein